MVEKVGEHDFPGLDVRVEIEIPLNTEDYNRRPARQPIRLQTLRCLTTRAGGHRARRHAERTTKDHQDKPSGEQSKGPPG